MLSKNLARVSRAHCVACGTCIRECPREALSVYWGCYAFVSQERCVGCGLCAAVCPAGCITIAERTVKQI